MGEERKSKRILKSQIKILFFLLKEHSDEIKKKA